MSELDSAIIGAGPAGLSAGIYALRKGMRVRVFEKNVAGGHTNDSVLVENYPGFKAIKGMDLVKRMQEHFESVDGKIEEGIAVDRVEKKKEGDLFKLQLSNGETIKAKTIIIATGSEHRKLPAKNAEKLEGKGVHFCATCDGPLYKGGTVAVIGGGNSGVTNALYLDEICERVYLIEFTEEIKADEVYKKQLEESNTKVILNAGVTEVLGEESVKGLKYEDGESGQEKELELGGIFVYIGLKPNNEIAKQVGCGLTKEGFVKVNEGMYTSCEGVFAAGDITGVFAQTIVAAGQGAIAAEAAYWYLRNLERIK